MLFVACMSLCVKNHRAAEKNTEAGPPPAMRSRARCGSSSEGGFGQGNRQAPSLFTPLNAEPDNRRQPAPNPSSSGHRSSLQPQSAIGKTTCAAPCAGPKYSSKA